MYCTRCGKKLPEGSSFCDGCGAAQGAAGDRKEEKSENKGRKALIAAILVFALLVGVLGGALLGLKLGRKDKAPEPSAADDAAITAASTPDPGTESSSSTASASPGTEPVVPEQQPLLPNQPDQPNSPAQPGQPSRPDQPDQPSRPDQPSQPSQPDQPSQPSRPDQPAADSLRLDHMEHMQNGQFKLAYPVFAGPRSGELNTLVSEFAMNLGLDGGIRANSYEADYLCEVTLVNDSLVSMVFCGTGYVEGAAHDFRDVVPLNVEIGQMRPITLWDIFAMDMDGFTDIVYSQGQPYGAAWSIPAADFPDLFDLEKEIYQGLTKAPDGFLTPRGPVLLTYVGVTGVEWLDVLVPIELLKDYYNYDLIPWEMLYTNN